MVGVGIGRGMRFLREGHTADSKVIRGVRWKGEGVQLYTKETSIREIGVCLDWACVLFFAC